MFSVYTPVYLYTALVLYFIALLALNSPVNATPSLYLFHRNNKTPAVRLLFILTLASMLGTPPTIGFFAKILTFFVLIKTPGIALFASILLTLVLLVFYLQTIRTGNTLKKGLIWSGNNCSHRSMVSLVYIQLLFLLFVVTVPYLLDIAYCLFI